METYRFCHASTIVLMLSRYQEAVYICVWCVCVFVCVCWLVCGCMCVCPQQANCFLYDLHQIVYYDMRKMKALDFSVRVNFMKAGRTPSTSLRRFTSWMHSVASTYSFFTSIHSRRLGHVRICDMCVFTFIRMHQDVHTHM
jgi:hypothetical protein